MKACPDIPSLISLSPACLPSGQAEEMDKWISVVAQCEQTRSQRSLFMRTARRTRTDFTTAAPVSFARLSHYLTNIDLVTNSGFSLSFCHLQKPSILCPLHCFLTNSTVATLHQQKEVTVIFNTMHHVLFFSRMLNCCYSKIIQMLKCKLFPDVKYDLFAMSQPWTWHKTW